MPPYLQRGTIPPKRHTAHRTSPGFKNEGIYYEEVITTQGFSRAYSIVYHLRPPTRVRKVEPAGTSKIELAPQPALRHHHLKSGKLPAKGDPVTGRVPIFTNADVTMWRCRPAQPQAELYRNAAADEILFVHKGKGTLHTLFGPLPFKQYDYVVLPKTTTYRVEFDAAGGPPDLLVIESPGAIHFPPRYLNPDGQFRLGAPFAERDLHGPPEAQIGRTGQQTDLSIGVAHGGLTAIVRGIVHHDDFMGTGEPCLLNRLQTTLQVLPAVVIHDDDCEIHASTGHEIRFSRICR